MSSQSGGEQFAVRGAIVRSKGAEITEPAAAGNFRNRCRVRVFTARRAAYPLHSVKATIIARAHAQHTLAAFTQHPGRRTERCPKFGEAWRWFRSEQFLETGEEAAMPAGRFRFFVDWSRRQLPELPRRLPSSGSRRDCGKRLPAGLPDSGT